MAIPRKQEPKYDCDTNGIFNRQSGEPIPPDEPVFILRARDLHALTILDFYAGIVANQHHRLVVNARYNTFREFALNNPERMKEPDTHESIQLD